MISVSFYSLSQNHLKSVFIQTETFVLFKLFHFRVVLHHRSEVTHFFLLQTSDLPVVFVSQRSSPVWGSVRTADTSSLCQETGNHPGDLYWRRERRVIFPQMFWLCVFLCVAVCSCGGWTLRWPAPWGRGVASNWPPHLKPTAAHSRTSGERALTDVQEELNIVSGLRVCLHSVLFQERDLHHRTVCSAASDGGRGGGRGWTQNSSQTELGSGWGGCWCLRNILKESFHIWNNRPAALGHELIRFRWSEVSWCVQNICWSGSALLDSGCVFNGRPARLVWQSENRKLTKLC